MMDNYVQMIAPFKRAMLWIWGITAILVFAPETLHQRLGFADQMTTMMPWIGFVFVCLSAGFVTEAMLTLIQSGGERLRGKRARTQLTQKMAMLDHEEKAVLREFFIQRKHTVQLPFAEPAVRSLVEAHILQPVQPNLAEEHGLFRLNQWARPLLTSKVLNLPTGGLTEDHIRYIKSTRPEFVIRDIRSRSAKAA